MADLHIRTLDADLRVPAAEARLRGGLLSALERRLDAALAGAGLAPDADLAVRALDVSIDEDASEDRWAEAILLGLARLLGQRRTPGAGGGADDRIAWFPSRIDSGKAALQAVARQQVVPWWWESLVGPEEARRLAGPEGLEALLLDWVAREPAAAPAALAGLLVEVPDLLARLGEERGARLQDALLAGRARRLEALGAAEQRASSPAPPSEGGDPELAFILRLAGTVAPQEAAGLARLTPRVATCFAICLALRASPGLSRPQPLGEALLRALQARDGAGRSEGTPARRPPQATRDGSAPPAVPTGPWLAPPAARPPDPEPIQEIPPTSLAYAQTVGLGGLLFLLRWLARDPLLAEAPGSCAPRLASFARVVLEAVLAPLPPEQRDRQLRVHRPLLEVFAGSPETDAVPDELPAAKAALDRLRAALPVGLEARPEAVAWTFRDVPDALEQLPPEDRALAILVLRPGRLHVESHSAVLDLSTRLIDINIRQGGWDLDPGWFPWTGRVIRLRYVEEP